MSDSHSLRNRVAVTLALFGAVVSLTLAVTIYLMSHDLERRLVDDTLTAELDDLVERHQRNPLSLPERTATIRAFVIPDAANTTPVPASVAALPPGQHQLVLDQTPYRAAVRRVADQQFVVLYDVSALQRRERGFMLLLAGSVVLITVIAALSGRWLATRAIAPVTALVRRAAELRPDESHRPLAGEFPWIEVQQLAADLDAYRARLHEFIERERLFTGDVSHELRTPLTVISGAAELMLADTTLDEDSRARASRIGRAVAEMSEMTGALLALAREQDSASAPSPSCDVPETIAELIERYRALSRGKPVELQLEVVGRPQVHADRAVLAMVVGNLLRNALSFTSEGQIRVQVEADAIAVHDTGVGIGDVDVSTLFQPYVRGPASDGAGLGLSLVQRLCERHGWRVTLANLPGGGTLARLELGSSAHATSAAGKEG